MRSEGERLFDIVVEKDLPELKRNLQAILREL